jgi:uncharacterized protein DUF955
VKRFRDSKTGVERLWIEPEEIEVRTDAELVRAGLMPSIADPAVNVEAFVEQHLKAQFDQYASLPADVLGQTDFRVGDVPLVMVNADLTGAAFDDDESPLGIKGRWRATVAHEACHILFHRCLYNLNPEQGSLFGDEDSSDQTAPRLQRCLKRDVAYGRMASDWREVQANMGMAALLMPRRLFIEASKQELSRLGADRVLPDTPVAAKLAGTLATAFQVSIQATMIRLKTLEVLAIPRQNYLV